MKLAAVAVIFLTVSATTGELGSSCLAQARTTPPEVYERVDVLMVDAGKARQMPARMRLGADSLIVESAKTGARLKEIRYELIQSAEYSYSNHPRWKAGAGTIAGSFLFPPFLFLTMPFAIPLAFSKSRRHWLTVRSESDFVVLRLDKRNRQLILPAFEVHSGVKVASVGEK